MASNVIMSDEIINQILTIQGFPVIQLQDLEGLNNTDDFKNYIVLPALRKYFSYFPIITEEDRVLGNGNFVIDFPLDTLIPNIYNATLKTNIYSSYGGMSTLYNNPFVAQQYITQSSVMNELGSVYDYGLQQAYTYKRIENQSIASTYKAFRYTVDVDNRRIVGYNNISAKTCISWKSWSYDYTVIERRFYHIEDFLDFCRSKLLRYLAVLRGQQKSGQSVEFNYDLLLNEAKDLEEKVITKWSTSMQDPVIVRM